MSQEQTYPEEIMQVTIENKELVIRIPVQTTPQPSKSGKTLIVATSNGNVATSCIVDGKPVVIGLNAYISR
jgi:hypothetical protein